MGYTTLLRLHSQAIRLEEKGFWKGKRHLEYKQYFQPDLSSDFRRNSASNSIFDTL